MTAGHNGAVHLWLDQEPDPLFTATLPLSMPGVLVIHGHGSDGGLPVPAPHLAPLIAVLRQDHGVPAIVLLACQQQTGQQFATDHRLTTWSTPHKVWVSPSTARCSSARPPSPPAGSSSPPSPPPPRCTATTPAPTRRSPPAGLSPVTVLTPEQAAASPATDWEERLRPATLWAAFTAALAAWSAAGVLAGQRGPRAAPGDMPGSDLPEPIVPVVLSENPPSALLPEAVDLFTRTTGKLFPINCTATVVESKSCDLLWTAGHCVWNGGFLRRLVCAWLRQRPPALW